jgi:hypothetical protein
MLLSVTDVTDFRYQAGSSDLSFTFAFRHCANKPCGPENKSGVMKRLLVS